MNSNDMTYGAPEVPAVEDAEGAPMPERKPGAWSFEQIRDKDLYRVVAGDGEAFEFAPSEIGSKTISDLFAKMGDAIVNRPTLGDLMNQKVQAWLDGLPPSDAVRCEYESHRAVGMLKAKVLAGKPYDVTMAGMIVLIMIDALNKAGTVPMPASAFVPKRKAKFKRR